MAISARGKVFCSLRSLNHSVRPPSQILGKDALRSVGLGKSKRKSERNEGLSALPE